MAFLGKLAISVARASPKRVDEFLNPCRSRIQVNCICHPVSSSVHSKANKGWLWGTSQRQKKSSFRSRQVNHLAVPGIWLRIVYRFGSTGCRKIVTLLIAHRSWAGWYLPPPVFLTGSSRVFQGNWHLTKIPASLSLVRYSWIPIFASCKRGYSGCFCSWAPRTNSKMTGAWLWASRVISPY